MAIRDAVQALGIQVRTGLHTGEWEVRGDGIGGIGVHELKGVPGQWTLFAVA